MNYFGENYWLNPQERMGMESRGVYNNYQQAMFPGYDRFVFPPHPPMSAFGSPAKKTAKRTKSKTATKKRKPGRPKKKTGTLKRKKVGRPKKKTGTKKRTATKRKTKRKN